MLFTSNLADPSGVVVPIPTCAKVVIEKNINDANKIIFIMCMIIYFNINLLIKYSNAKLIYLKLLYVIKILLLTYVFDDYDQKNLVLHYRAEIL